MMEVPNYAPGMRHAAAQLRPKIESTAALPNNLEARVAAMAYAGPAADRFYSELTTCISMLRQAGNLTNQLSDILIRDAQKIESQAMGGFPTGGAVQ